LAAILTALLTSGVLHFRARPSSPIDYAAIAAVISNHSEPGDVILAPQRKWYFTPLLYYLDLSRVIGNDYQAAISRQPQPRVWVVQMWETELSAEMNVSLSGLRIIKDVSLRRDRILLFARESGSRGT
jgi:hypothetical protein